MNHSSGVLPTSFPVGLCSQPSCAQHWLNIQACSEKGDVRHWQIARCWQWVAARLPIPQFTWRFIKHFGQAPLEKASSWCNLSPVLRDTVMFLHESPQTMGERSVTGHRREGRAGRKQRGGGSFCIHSSLSSYLLWWQMAHPTIHFPFIPVSPIFFASPFRPHVVTGI